MTRATAARASRPEASRFSFPALWEYFNRSERPLTSLIFVLPMIIVYAVGTSYLPNEILAAGWLRDFLALFGATGKHLPAFTVIVVLLCWHVARRDSWDVNPLHLLGMCVESLILVAPLLLLCWVAAIYLPMAGSEHRIPNLLTLFAGAGVYEELVFRLGAFSVLGLLFVDLLKFKKRTANILMVVIAALAFSLYHYWGAESFQLRTFAVRTAAGIYFGVVFAFRGFGISAGCHSSYDLVVHLLRAYW